MKAALLHKVANIETNPLRIEEIEAPTPGRGQILVRILGSGVCRSNLNMVEGDWVNAGVPPKYPIIPGHEVAGVVAEVGEGVQSVRKNDSVGMQPLWTSCGSCEWCLTGGEYFCSKREILGETVDGGFAEYILGYEGHVYPIPSGLDPVVAAPLFCPGITAYGAVKKAAIGPGAKVAVFGAGGVGHLAIQLAKLYGADVYAVTRSKMHLELASELGATPVDGSIDPVSELSKVGKMDSTIVFAPSTRAAMQAVKSTKPRGTIVIGAPGAIEEFPFDEEKRIVGTLVGGRQAMREVISLAAAGKLVPVTEKRPLEEANQALNDLKKGEVRARIVLAP